ncbi:iron-containing alcohol dehydrogenase [Acuticoccus sp. MNP-M23]|uniref:iron-containing alcohol dehydrogenase n=1 Tax=Acuticoccus sp. MNP-M23 TaxID=3072793 RepID=UPI0028152ECC|nr:iron-containing alcohol dehydrogenase [Acuticoccus sp. MNP-M23]WMS40922.1 iron-containing alcohol dehydrogenase [Acuticoccus sp. MNP-M23]
MSMSQPITLHQPRRVEIGAGKGRLIGEWAATFDGPVLVISGKSTARLAGELGLGSAAIFDGVLPEPETGVLDAALEMAREVRPAAIVGLGGGSPMDVAKLVAAMWDGTQTIEDVSGNDKVKGRNTALAQVPTTAGTGSEAGIRALVTNPDTHAKIAVGSAHMIADLAVLDPVLTHSVPPAITAATGVDALAHCVEAFTSLKSHDLVDDFARRGMALVGRYLARAVADGSDTEARAGMMLASFYGGVCLGPVNTAAGHALAYPLGTRLGMAHGLANAIIFPHVLAFNQQAVPEKTAEIATALGIPAGTDVLAGAREWCESLGVEMRMSAHGAKAGDLPAWAEEAHAIRRLMDNNPRDMSADDVLAIYRAAG